MLWRQSASGSNLTVFPVKSSRKSCLLWNIGRNFLIADEINQKYDSNHFMYSMFISFHIMYGLRMCPCYFSQNKKKGFLM